MKRFVITISCLIGVAFILLAWFYVGGVHIDIGMEKDIVADVRIREKSVQIYTDEGWTDFEIRGVNIGSGMPGEWSTDYAADKDTYLRWFEQIKNMGANVIRVYAVQNSGFYKALDIFNRKSETPLYLIQGVWVNYYVQNSHMDAYNAEFGLRLRDDCKATVDVVHGKRFLLNNTSNGCNGIFLCDVSQWVLGYVIGCEWTDVTVAYTNEKYSQLPAYRGEYLYTAENSNAFEKLLAEAGDQMISYETVKYNRQKPVSFANGRTTDPFTYSEEISEFFGKCAAIDMEHIRATENFNAGLFASYSAYTYDMDYLSLMNPNQWHELTDKAVDFSDCNGTSGEKNTYLAYLKLLNAHHTMPVVITDFGEASGRGLAQQNGISGFRNGCMSETEQANAIVSCYRDILASGCSGGLVFAWQDEWYKRTWNTMFGMDLSRNVYWSDAQTADQHFGLLAFDPGESDICVVDGNVSEWSEQDIVKEYEDGSSISMKYDERYVYLRVHKPNYVFGKEALYIPIDVTPKTGTNVCPAYGLEFDKAADFLLKIHGFNDSVLLVQNRYHAIHANYEGEITGEDAYINPPAKDSTEFEIVQMATKDVVRQYRNSLSALDGFETGRLHYGNADPTAANYNSLTDFSVDGENAEIRLPWSLLNFADPSAMKIHDDYYDGNYGVEFISANSIYIGLANNSAITEMGEVPLKGWRNNVSYHERLKPAYYALQKCWIGGEH